MSSSNVLSDYNRSSGATSVVASNTYTDLSNAFIHPATGDAVIARDLEAIKNSIKNIILTPIGRRPFFPEFGTHISSLLFENFSYITASALENEIRSGIEKFESRIEDLAISAIPNEDANSYTISITFSPYFGGIFTLEFILNRVR